MLNDIIEFLTSKEMIIVGAIALTGILLTLFVYIMEKTKDKRKKRHNTKEIKHLALKVTKEEKKAMKENRKDAIVTAMEKQAEVKPTPEVAVQPKVEKKPEVVVVEQPKVEPILTIMPVIEEQPLVIPKEETIEVLEEVEEPKVNVEAIKEKKEEELIYTSIEPNEEEAREELRRATENLLRKASEEALEEEMKLNKFEAEQEKNAIISIDEFLQKGSELYSRNEQVQYEDEESEPISLADLDRKMNSVEVLEVEQPKVEVQPVVEEVQPVVKEEPVVRFKSSPIISPIFGIESNTPTDNDMELENTANYDKFDAEMRRTNEFVTTLKELQKKL